MKRHFKTLAMVMTCMAMTLCVSCKKDNENEPSGGGDFIDGHEYVDLGLPSGLLWATCNVGASLPEDYGDYFAWAETQPKSYYDENTYTYHDSQYGDYTKYNDTDNLTILQAGDDAATANWSSGWRTPTCEEWEELLRHCALVWTTQNGVDGLRFTGTNGNTLFLPAAGCRQDDYLHGAGFYGDYWSSSLAPYGRSAWVCCFYSSNYGVSEGSRYWGHSVRPVCSARQK